MKIMTRILMIALCLGFFTSIQAAAPAMQKKAPHESVVSIYHIAPGMHVEFLKWMAAQESAAREAGLAPTQWYVHQQGDSWDYIGISPATTPEQDKMVDNMAAKMGLATGMKSSLEFRKYVMAHTDTFAMGPMSIDDVVAMATGK